MMRKSNWIISPKQSHQPDLLLCFGTQETQNFPLRPEKNCGSTVFSEDSPTSLWKRNDSLWTSCILQQSQNTKNTNLQYLQYRSHTYFRSRFALSFKVKNMCTNKIWKSIKRFSTSINFLPCLSWKKKHGFRYHHVSILSPTTETDPTGTDSVFGCAGPEMVLVLPRGEKTPKIVSIFFVIKNMETPKLSVIENP